MVILERSEFTVYRFTRWICGEPRNDGSYRLEFGEKMINLEAVYSLIGLARLARTGIHAHQRERREEV